MMKLYWFSSLNMLFKQKLKDITLLFPEKKGQISTYKNKTKIQEAILNCIPTSSQFTTPSQPGTVGAWLCRPHFTSYNYSYAYSL